MTNTPASDRDHLGDPVYDGPIPEPDPEPEPEPQPGDSVDPVFPPWDPTQTLPQPPSDDPLPPADPEPDPEPDPDAPPVDTGGGVVFG